MRPNPWSRILSAMLSVAIASTCFVHSPLVLHTSAANGTTYYVSNQTGNDSNSGNSPANPWKTLDKVNSITYQPGDHILLDNQSTWVGQLAPKGSGSSGNPIIIDKYGEGDRKPLIQGNGLIQGNDIALDPKPYNAAVLFYNQQHWEINNLEVTNFSTDKYTFQTYNEAGSVITKTNVIPSKYGILIIAKDSGIMRHMYVRDCNVHTINSDPVDNRGAGIGRGGIIYIIRGNSVQTKWDDILVENNKVGPEITHYGINFLSTWAGAIFPHESGVPKSELATTRFDSTNIIIRNNYCVDVGNAAISPSGYENVVIENNVSDVCNSGLNGNVPIWWQYGKNTIVQYNEVFGTGASTSKEDSQAFDGDLAATENIVQYNYTHDNPSGSYFECAIGSQYTTHYRYNISVNDGSGTNSHGGGAVVTIGGYSNNAASKLYVYNNDMFIGPGQKGYIANSWDTGINKDNFVFTNNVMYSDGNSKGWESKFRAGSTVNNNFYGGADSAAVTRSDDPNAVTGDIAIPGLTTSLNRTMADATGWDRINDYKRSESSALYRTGVNIPYNGGLDIYGNRVSPFGKPSIGAQEIGADTAVPENRVLLDFEDSSLPTNLYNHTYQGVKFATNGWKTVSSGATTELVMAKNVTDSRQNQIIIPKGFTLYGFTARTDNSAKITMSWDGVSQDFYLSSAKNAYLTKFTSIAAEDKPLYISLSSPYGVNNIYLDNLILAKADSTIPTNVALNKPASQNNGYNPASYGNDGNTSTFAGNTGVFPYIWSVDLQDTYQISKVEIEWESLYTGENGQGTKIPENWKYKIESSLDGVTWTPVVDYTASNPYTDPQNSVLQSKEVSDILAKQFRVTITGKPSGKPDAWAILPEFRAFGILPQENLDNVALNKPATQNNGGNPASRANDGNPSTFAGNTPTFPYIWSVDLQDAYQISKVEIEWLPLHTGENGQGSKIAEDWKYKIESSTDGTVWSTVVDYTTSNPFTDPENALLQSQNASDLVARHFRVTITGKPTGKPGAWAVLPEFRAFGVKRSDLMTDVALNKPAKQNAGLNSASLGNNGTNTNWAGNVNPNATPVYIWEVDLNGIYSINQVEIEWEDLWTGPDKTGINIAEDWLYKIEYSLNDADWHTAVDHSVTSPYTDPDFSVIQAKEFPEEIQARYFKVSINGRPSQRPAAWYILPAFRAFGVLVEGGGETADNPDNIAYGKPVLPSSDSSTLSAPNITDGTTASSWTASHTGETVRIDLGLTYDLTGADITFGSGSSGTVSVMVSEDSESWSPYWQPTGSTGKVSTSAAETARYFLVEADEPGVKIALFEAYGEVADSPHKTIMILAPHPDDEALMSGGVIKRALDNGDDVYVLLATLGDYNGITSGRNRMIESINAMQKLGLPLSKMIFLNYGDDGGLEQFAPQKFTDSMLYRLFVADDPTQVFTSRAGQTATYSGTRPSYHSQVHGVQADYTRESFLGDMQHAIDSVRPDEIYTTSRFDLHADHACIGFFAGESIINIKQQDSGFDPVVFEALIHSCEGDATWPEKNMDYAGIKPFTKPKNLEDVSLLDWNQRISITVPEVMQVVPFGQNLKTNALQLYTSQYSSYIGSFAKYDEVFWAQKYDSVSYFATATASSERASSDRSQDQSASKAIDGIADGYSTSLNGKSSHNRFPFAEWVSNGEKAGAWLNLAWDASYTIDRVTLYDRPNSSDQITAGTLYFSDGSSVDVGTLPRDGRPLEVTFTARTVKWLRFVVKEVSPSTQNVGLAEIEVFGSRSSTEAVEPQILLEPTYTVALGTSYQINATVEPVGAIDQLKWASGDEAVVIVDQTGMLSPVAVGTATITVSNTADLFTSTCQVEVRELVEGEVALILQPTRHTMTLGTSFALTVQTVPEDTDITLLWSTSNDDVATVDQDGMVFAANVGSAVITVADADGDASATCVITVIDGDDPGSTPVGYTVRYYVETAPGVRTEIAGSADHQVAEDGVVYYQDIDVDKYSHLYTFHMVLTPGGSEFTGDTATVRSGDTIQVIYTHDSGTDPKPPTTSGGSSSKSRNNSGSSVQDTDRPRTGSARAPTNTLSKATAITALEKALAGMESGAATVTVPFKNPGLVTKDILQEMVKKAGSTALTIQADNMSADGGSVEVRIRFDAAKATGDVNTTVSTSSAQAVRTKALFQKHYKASAQVLSYVQQGMFGAVVQVAVKLEPALATDNLHFYSYDKVDNIYRKIPVSTYRMDDKGYLHFESAYAGDILICDGPLVK